MSVLLSKCFYCGKDDAIVLFGAGYTEKDDNGVRRQKQAPMNIGVFSMDPCNECREFMKQGIIFISAKDMDYVAMRPEHKKKNCRPFIPNPYRTGGYWVLKEEAVRRIVPEGPLLEQMLKYRWTFIEDDAAHKLGLFDQLENRDHGCACGHYHTETGHPAIKEEPVKGLPVEDEKIITT